VGSAGASSTGSTASAGVGGAGAGTGAGGAGAGGAGAGTGGAGGGTPLEIAGKLLVSLDALDPTAGKKTWKNHGTLGDFQSAGAPQIETYMGVPAVKFNGAGDAYVGPNSVQSIEDNSDRTIEVWVNNPSIDSGEETMVSWSSRGGPDGTMMSFNYGHNSPWEAATHWGAADFDWGSMGAPAGNTWHHLVYTYDGSKARVYEDGAQKNEKSVNLGTKAQFPINLGAQRGNDQLTLFGTLYLAIVRIHDQALTATQVKNNFDAEKSRFQK
jgi:hypothetical protein